MKKLNCSTTSSYNELKESLHTLNCNSTIETHIAIEQVISSNSCISEDQKLFLLSSLFITSLGKKIFQPKYILARLEHLVIAPVTKQKLLILLSPNNEEMKASMKKKTTKNYYDSQFSAFKIKSLMTFRTDNS